MISIGRVTTTGIILAVMLPMILISSGCGSQGPGGGSGPTLIDQAPLYTVATPSTLIYGGNTATLSITGGSGTGAVTYSLVTSTGCSLNGTTVTETNASGACSAMATKAGDAEYYSATSAAITITLSKATPACSWINPASINNVTPLGATQLDPTCNVPGTFVYTPAAGTTLAVGTQTLSAAFTPTDAADYNTTTISTQIVVTQAAPVATSINPIQTYTDLPAGLDDYSFFGQNLLATDVAVVSGTTCQLSFWQVNSATNATFSIYCGGTNYSTGYIGINVCRAGGSPCSNVVYLPYTGPYYKGLALDNNGELAVLSGRTVYKFKVNGGTLTAAPSEDFNQIGLASDLVVDNKTGDYVLGDGSCTSNGTPVAGPNLNGAYDQWSDIAVKDSISGQTRPETDNVSFWNITQPEAALTTIALPTGSQPISIAMANFGTTTRYEYVVTRGGGSVLLRLFKNESAVGATSVAFTGATPANSYPVSTSVNGYPIVAFESGPAQGTIAVLDVGDGILSTFNQGATQELLNLKLSGTPIGIAKSETDGMILVFYDNAPATGQTTVAAVNALTGFNPSTSQPYARSATSKQYPNGAVVVNGYIMLSQGATPDSVPNQ